MWEHEGKRATAPLPPHPQLAAKRQMKTSPFFVSSPRSAIKEKESSAGRKAAICLRWLERDRRARGHGGGEGERNDFDCEDAAGRGGESSSSFAPNKKSTKHSQMLIRLLRFSIEKDVFTQSRRLHVKGETKKGRLSRAAKSV